MAELIIPNLVTRSGVKIPQLGFGTYKLTEGTRDIVLSAIDVGYRHLDTAQMYGNEDAVGEAWAQSGIPREDFFLTTKLDNPNHEPDDARRSIERSLRDLKTDYVDLFLIHWPLPMHYGGNFGRTWAVLEEFLALGQARSIGVSNFEPHHLETLLLTASTKPEVNQVESHPFLQNQRVHDIDAQHGILTEAWSPLARGRAAQDPTLSAIGSRHGKTAAQVALRWAIQRGDIVFPKASSRARQEENFDVFDFELSSEEMAEVYNLEEGEAGRTSQHPDRMDRLTVRR